MAKNYFDLLYDGDPGLKSSMGETGKTGDQEKALEEEAPFPLTETDRWVLSQTDEEFRRHTWDELKEIIGTTFLPFLAYSRQSHPELACAHVGLLQSF